MKVLALSELAVACLPLRSAGGFCQVKAGSTFVRWADSAAASALALARVRGPIAVSTACPDEGAGIGASRCSGVKSPLAKSLFSIARVLKKGLRRLQREHW